MNPGNRTASRFEVCSPVFGLIDTRTTRREALDFAEFYAETQAGEYRNEIRVYDVMARGDMPREWRYCEGVGMVEVL